MAGDQTWLDGPKLVAWLRSQGADLTAPSVGHRERAIRHWRRGGLAMLSTADELLVHLGLTLASVPGDCWVTANPRARRFSAQVRAAAARRVRAGADPQRVADEVGCSRRALGEWIGAAA